MINQIDLLYNIFNRLNDSIAYLKVGESVIYMQKNNSLRLVEIYFDIKSSNFLKRSTIEQNKEVLGKLKNYQVDHLVTAEVLENGYKFKVFNSKGSLIYAQNVLFYDKSSALLKYFLKKRYPDLVLVN